MPKYATLTATKIGGQPMDEVWMEVCVADRIKEEGVLDRVKSFRNVNSDDTSTTWRFLFVEAVGNLGDGWEQSGCS